MLRFALLPLPAGRRRYLKALLFHASLMRTGDAHVFAVLCHRAARDLDALRLQDAGDLLISQRTGWIFLVDQLLYASLQNEQRCVAALRPLHTFGEEIPQFEHSLRGVGVLAGYRATDGGWVH